MSVCLSVRMNAETSETRRARLLRFGMQIPELLTQRKFVSAACHAYSNAHKRGLFLRSASPSLVHVLTILSCRHRVRSDRNVRVPLACILFLLPLLLSFLRLRLLLSLMLGLLPLLLFLLPLLLVFRLLVPLLFWLPPLLFFGLRVPSPMPAEHFWSAAFKSRHWLRFRLGSSPIFTSLSELTTGSGSTAARFRNRSGARVGRAVDHSFPGQFPVALLGRTSCTLRHLRCLSSRSPGNYAVGSLSFRTYLKFSLLKLPPSMHQRQMYRTVFLYLVATKFKLSTTF